MDGFRLFEPCAGIERETGSPFAQQVETVFTLQGGGGFPVFEARSLDLECELVVLFGIVVGRLFVPDALDGLVLPADDEVVDAAFVSEADAVADRESRPRVVSAEEGERGSAVAGLFAVRGVAHLEQVGDAASRVPGQLQGPGILRAVVVARVALGRTGRDGAVVAQTVEPEVDVRFAGIEHRVGDRFAHEVERSGEAQRESGAQSVLDTGRDDEMHAVGFGTRVGLIGRTSGIVVEFEGESQPVKRMVGHVSREHKALGVEVRGDRIAEDERIVVGNLQGRVPTPGELLSVVVSDASGADDLVEALPAGHSDAEVSGFGRFVQVVEVAAFELVIGLEVDHIAQGREPQRRRVVAFGEEVSGAFQLLVDGELHLLLSPERGPARKHTHQTQNAGREFFHDSRSVR